MGTSFASPAMASAPDYNSPPIQTIQTALSQPCGNMFWIERKGGRYRMGNPKSQFNGKTDFDELTFDISNNKVLANVNMLGTIKTLTIYRDTYRGMCMKESWPGVWTAKDNSSFGTYFYTLTVDGQTYDLSKVDWDFKTGLLDNIFPLTELRDPQGRFTVRLITYAPLSPDGSTRLRGIIYGLLLESTSDTPLKGTVHLPRPCDDGRMDLHRNMPWSRFDPYDFEYALGDSSENKWNIPFDLKKGESIWVPTVLFMPAEPTWEEVNAHGSLAWLNDSWKYYRNLLGRVETPGNPFIGESYERELMQCLQGIAMSGSGKIAGANWGSYPATRQIWIKDMYYACVPLMAADPALAQKIILWFDEFAIRQKGNMIAGGINHATGLTVASMLLASFYYDQTGDKTFFTEHAELKDAWGKLLDDLVATRVDTDIYLFPSRFVSDAATYGDYHTGSNVCVWRALKGYARLLEEVYGDPRKAAEYAAIADKVKAAILDKGIIDGPFGRQYIEGTFRDNRPVDMVSDGEESDTTLMPFYGFLPYDDPAYLNYMHFSMSPHNRIYQPKLRAITWDSPGTPLDAPSRVQSTAPGYTKGLCFGADTESLLGENGYLTEIQRVTDADGSVWWWSYGWAGKDKVYNYGDVVRGIPGKAGWFAGLYCTILPSRLMGLCYDAPSATLKFAPLAAMGNFTWKGCPMGANRYNVSYRRTGEGVSASVGNTNKHAVRFEACLPVGGVGGDLKVMVNGKAIGDYKMGKSLGQLMVGFSLIVAAGATVDVEICR